MRNLDRISVIGIFLGIAAILVGQILEGGNVASLLQLTAFVIVIGGTAGAIMLQSTPRIFLSGMRLVRWVFLPPAADFRRQLDQLVNWSQTARRGGLLALEDQLRLVPDGFQRKALQMLVDGAEPEALRETMDLEVSAYEEGLRQAAKVWESAGGYSPTIGILGAVMGLIHVMENLTDPSKLGAGIAVAFVATIYGVGAANLIFLPIANKLKSIIAVQIKLREMYVDGLVAISTGDNPRLIQARLSSYLSIG